VLARLKLRHDGADEACRDLVLQFERRLGATVVTIGPQQVLGASIGELRADADMAALPAKRAVQHVTDAAFGGAARRIGALRWWNDAARDHDKLPEANECRCQFIRQPDQETILSGVTRQVGERNDEHRRLVAGGHCDVACGHRAAGRPRHGDGAGEPVATARHRPNQPLARAAAELGADNALTLTRAAHAISVLGNDVDGGAVLAERALKLNPLLDDAWYVSGWTMLIAGKPKLAHERLLRARQLSAHDHLIFKIDAASAYALFFTGRYDDATDAAMSALRTQPNYLTAFRIAAASDVLAGRTEQGRRYVAKMRAGDPKLRLSGLPELLPFRRREEFDCWAGALQLACLPDYRD